MRTPRMGDGGEGNGGDVVFTGREPRNPIQHYASMTLSTAGLISNYFSAHTANAYYASNSEVLEYYIHNGTGFAEFDDYTFGYSLGHSNEEANFIRSIFDRLDQYIDLDFRESFDWNGTTFDIYSLGSYSEWDETTVGMANAQGYASGSYWDVYWRDTDGAPSLSQFDANTIVHEIGHALGLSHPYEDPHNGNWNTDDTVMSYNISPDGWDTWFSDNDLAALIEIWGVEDDRDPSSGLQGQILNVQASTWSASIEINRELIGSFGSGVLQAKQVEKDNWTGPTGSLITGSSGDDIIRGLGGWDILDGGAGDDLIHGGNGRDIITGGSGSDELHGDFGWNTYSNQRDGSVDLIAIKSDQFLSNWWYGKAGNSPNGEKSDIIEGLDSTDQIKIIGVATSDLSFSDGISHKGVTGIGIYAKGVLEALYTGGDLSVSQISSMTTGDNSAQAMANQLWSYWGDNTVPALLA